MKPKENPKLKKLEALVKKRGIDEAKFFPKFEKQARYLGNNTYTINGYYSTDTRELFLMWVLGVNGVDVDKILG
jgi:hypothetical protein